MKREDSALAFGRPARGRVAQWKAQVIAPMLRLRWENNQQLLFGERQMRCMDDLAESIARRCGVSRRTVWRWYSRFQNFGYRGLAVAARSDKGTSRFFARHPVAAIFVQHKFVVDGWSVRAIHDALSSQMKGEAPSYGTVLDYVRAHQKLAGRPSSKMPHNREERALCRVTTPTPQSSRHLAIPESQERGRL
jgi:hypothetical protein